MPRRRRNRNQKRRNAAGDCSGPTTGGGGNGKGSGGEFASDEYETIERQTFEVSRPAEGLRGEVLTLAILNDNLQTTRVHRTDEITDGKKRDSNDADADRSATDHGRLNEINGKINSLMSAVLMATPPLSARLDTPSIIIEREPNILNNMTPKRSFRNTRNEPYIDNLCTSSSTALLKTNRPYKFRSNSSTSKLRSPGIEKTPITIDASTQTVRFEREKIMKEESLHLESCINIFDTPKLSQLDLLKTPVQAKKRIDIEKLDFKPLNLNRVRYKKMKNFSEILFGDNEFKNLSDTEISFQNLIDTGDISTPIEKKINNDKINNNAMNTNNKNSIVNNQSKEKVKAKKFEASLVTKRRYKTISPRKNREVAIRNVPLTCELKKKIEKPLIPKSFTPPRVSHCKPTENILNVSTDQGRFVTRAKRFHTRFVTRWIARISEICSWLGLSLKKTLSPATTTCNPKAINNPTTIDMGTWINPTFEPSASRINNQASNVLTTCINCEEYKLKLVVLSSKIEVLERELNKSTMESRETIANLIEEIAKIKLELSSIDVIKKQLNEMEEIVKRQTQPFELTAPPPPPPPPCAPPAPPPLPPPMLNLNFDTPITRPRSGGGGAKRSERKSNENSRPVISLDDILKVKLKKTTDKPLSARRSQQPLISVEMLNQIKLRPTSRPETPSRSTTSSNVCTLPNSPSASLSKILSSVDTNVRKIKRLRRPNGYSLDDFSRRRVMRREWSGADDT